MMLVNHVQSHVCHIAVLADAGTSTSNRTLTAVDLTATVVIVNMHFLNVTYSPFKQCIQFMSYLLLYVENVKMQSNVVAVAITISIWNVLK